jgi:hypothetical protein
MAVDRLAAQACLAQKVAQNGAVVLLVFTTRIRLLIGQPRIAWDRNGQLEVNVLA